MTAWTTCPICSQPMSTRRGSSRPRITCSRTCRDNKNRALDDRIDEMAVIRLLQGSPVNSTRGERIQATGLLTERGRSTLWIAEYLHTTPRSVTRYRAELHKRKAVA